MTLEHKNFCRRILLACSVYFLICGVSAIFFPKSWLWVAGLSTNSSRELDLVFSVLGAYLVALSIGAWLASRDPLSHRGIILVLLLSQVFDFLCTLRAVYSESLPVSTGSAFLVATVIWSFLLFSCQRNKST